MQKLKFKNIKQVKLGMFKRDSWLSMKTLKKDQKCENCNTQYITLNTDIAFATSEPHRNYHLCEDCGQGYIDMGAEDIVKAINDRATTKDELITMIMDLDNYRETRWTGKLEDLNVEELQKLYDKQRFLKDEEIRIDAIVLPDDVTDQYLFDDYSLIEDRKYLKCPEQIQKYFKDCGRDFFDCGQGYAQDEVNITCKIGYQYFSVTIAAEIGSAKQEYGDRLYWVEGVEDVSWVEIPKPEPKSKPTITYSFELSEDQNVSWIIY